MMGRRIRTVLWVILGIECWVFGAIGLAIWICERWLGFDRIDLVLFGICCLGGMTVATTGFAIDKIKEAVAHNLAWRNILRNINP